MMGCRKGFCISMTSLRSILKLRSTLNRADQQLFRAHLKLMTSCPEIVVLHQPHHLLLPLLLLCPVLCLLRLNDSPAVGKQKSSVSSSLAAYLAGELHRLSVNLTHTCLYHPAGNHLRCVAPSPSSSPQVSSSPAARQADPGRTEVSGNLLDAVPNSKDRPAREETRGNHCEAHELFVCELASGEVATGRVGGDRQRVSFFLPGSVLTWSTVLFSTRMVMPRARLCHLPLM